MEWELLVGQIELIVEKIRFLWRNLMIFDIERWSFFVFDLEDVYFLIT